MNSTQQIWSSRRQSSISKPNITHTSELDSSKQPSISGGGCIADNSRSSSNHQHLEGVKYTDAYRRLIKSHKENSNKIKVKSGRHVHISNIEENTTEMEFDSSADTNQNTISISSELTKIQNKIKAEIDFTEDLKYSSKSDKEARKISIIYENRAGEL